MHTLFAQLAGRIGVIRLKISRLLQAGESRFENDSTLVSLDRCSVDAGHRPCGAADSNCPRSDSVMV